MTMTSICRNCCGELKEWTQCFLCCRCVPKFVCVSATSEDYGCECDTVLMGPVSISSSQATYAGTLSCGDISIDLTLYFEKATCNFYLESECLGLTGANRLSMPTGVGQCLNDGSAFEFGVQNAGDCNPYAESPCNELVITVRPLELEENPLECGCAGFVPVLCFLYTAPEYSVTAEATFDGQDWTATIEIEDSSDVTFIVYLECDPYLGLVLRLESSLTPAQDTVAIGCSNEIANTTASWDLGSDRSLSVSPKMCVCNNTVSELCCEGDPDYALPRGLVAFFEEVDYCGCVFERTEVPLTYDDSDGLWHSNEDPITDCPGAEISPVLFGNDVGGCIFFFKAQTLPVDAWVAASTPICDPFMAEFSSPDGCIKVTITEN